MTATELIVKLAQMPPELEVVIDSTKPNEEMFRLEMIDEAAVIETSNGEKFILLNPPGSKEIEWEN